METINPFLGTIIGNMVLGLGIIATILIVQQVKNKFIKDIDYLTSITVGILLGIIFLGFIPEIISEGNIKPNIFGLLILSGIIGFYVLELFFHWHHCKDLGHSGHHCQNEHLKEHKSSLLMFSGTFVHNALHGIVLLTAFGVNLHLGIATTLAILLHSIPQNLANYVMNHKNIKYAYIAAFGGIFGALLTYPFYNIIINLKFEILAVITGTLLYTSMTDILPNVKEKGDIKNKFLYLALIIIGVFIYSLIK